MSHNKIYLLRAQCSRAEIYINTPGPLLMGRLTLRVLVDRRWHSSILDLRSFKGTDCDADHHFVFAHFRKRLSVNKRAAQKFRKERLNPKNLSDVEVREVN